MVEYDAMRKCRVHPPDKLQEKDQAMSNVDYAHQLAFPKLNESEIELLAGMAKVCAFEDGETIFQAGQRGLPCTGYTPQQVKGAVCGNGRADKGQVTRMVKTLLALERDPHPDHAADALAVAICHVNCAPLTHALAKVGG